MALAPITNLPAREAEEKLRLGMKIGIREGSVAKNLADLVKPGKLVCSRSNS